jgi:hypothetical protein
MLKKQGDIIRRLLGKKGKCSAVGLRFIAQLKEPIEVSGSLRESSPSLLSGHVSF